MMRPSNVKGPELTAACSQQATGYTATTYRTAQTEAHKRAHAQAPTV